MVQETALLLLKVTAIYFMAINLVYGLLMVLSWMKVKRFMLEEKNIKRVSTSPGVSFLVPVYNEETLIVETIQTYLSLPQENKEIIVINDGSHDQTMRLLQTMFQLRREELNSRNFRSITQPFLRVIEAPHCGKAEALNLGVSQAKYDLICTMDADTIPDARGVEICLRTFATDPKLIAVGGVIQVLDSHMIHNNAPLKSETRRWLPQFQRIEYLRAFVCERLGWSFLRSTVLISGAFCMVKKEAIREVGGFSKRSITEDLDLIIRLRRHYKDEPRRFRILPVTTCYTQVPSTHEHLRHQRIRWQQGLVQTLSKHPGLVFNPGHGLLGMFAIPYMWLVEVCSPLLEGIAWLVVPYAVAQGWVPFDVVVFYLTLAVVFNVLITLLGVHLDNRYVSRTRHWSVYSSVVTSILLHFGYKQLNSWWRLQAIMRSLKTASWGDHHREEIIHQSV